MYLILLATLGPGAFSVSIRSTGSIQIMFLGNKARPVHRADNLAVIFEPIV
jgi:hypothetical protein